MYGFIIFYHVDIKVRVGEVGGGNLGFYGGVFSPDGKSILSHGFQGAFHVWHQQGVGSF